MSINKYVEFFEIMMILLNINISLDWRFMIKKTWEMNILTSYRWGLLGTSCFKKDGCLGGRNNCYSSQKT